MPEFSSLELFVEVARCRSFSRAADRVGVSQSAVSQRVSHLEKTLGVTLLDRSSRPLSLTDAGRVLLEDGGPLASAYRELSERVAAMGRGDADHGESPAGPIRVRGIYSTGIDWLNGVAEAWTEQAVDRSDASRRWDLAFASHEAVREALLHGRADLGVVSYPAGLEDAWGTADADRRRAEPAGRWAWRALRDEALALICPPGHRWTREPAVAARHLDTEALLSLDASLPLGRALADYLVEHRGSGAATSTNAGYDNLDTLKAAILATGQPAILPQRCVAAEVEAGRLIAVTLRPAIARPLAVAYRLPRDARSDQPPARLAEAVDFLTAHAHDRPQPQTSASFALPNRLAPLNAATG